MTVLWMCSWLASAQAPPPQATVSTPADPTTTRLLQTHPGKSLVLELPRAPVSASITDDSVADVQTLGTPSTLLVRGLKIGTTDLVVVLGADRIEMWDIEVTRDLAPLTRTVEDVVRRRNARSTTPSEPLRSPEE
ncbi:MAG: pilus assembly protein N-terminal domain-containing protein [Myxococcales bacterium]|nr:pilus assembly protein N-terminal domain-containing protein [Myxococcales bacterium]